MDLETPEILKNCIEANKELAKLKMAKRLIPESDRADQQYPSVGVSGEFSHRKYRHNDRRPI